MKNWSKELNKGSTKEFLQDWSIVEDIRYGMIITKDRRYLTIVEVSPINYHLRTYEEQNNIIEQFSKWFRIAPSKMQFLIHSDSVNTNELIKNIRKNTKEEKNESFISLREDYIENSVRRLASDNTLTKKFLIVLQYEKNIDGSVSTDEIEIASALSDLRRKTQGYFQKFGCIVADHEDENFFLGQCLYRGLNPMSARAEDFTDRIERVQGDQCFLQRTLRPCVDINDYLVGRGMDDRNPHFVFHDGVYQETVYVKGRTLPFKVYGGWFDNITSCGKGYEISVTVEKVNKEIVKDQTARSMRLSRTSMRNSGNAERIDELQMDVSNNEYIYRTLKNTDEDIYNVCILIKMTAATYEELVRMKKDLIAHLLQTDVQIGNCHMRQREALMMSLPLLYIARPIFEKGKRNFLTSSLASIFPFTSFELYSPKGVVFGINSLNNSLTVVDLFDTKRFANANVSIFGESGSGKTYTEQILGYGFRLSGYKVFYILPVKGHEYRRGCGAINGSYNKFTPGGIKYNPLGIIAENSADESLLEGDGYVRASYLSKKITEFKAFTQLLLKNAPMTYAEEAKFDVMLGQLYRNYGITDDNDSIYADKEKQILKKMPIIGDLYKMLMNEPKMERIATAYEIFVHGNWQNFNTQTSIDLSNDYQVFDVDKSDIPKNLHAPFLLLATLISYSYIKASRTEKCVLFIDEVWQAMLTEESAELVFEIVKIVRGYGGSVVLGTQDLNDYFGLMEGKYAKGILNNTKIKLILHTEEDADVLAEKLKLSNDENKMIRELRQGQGLLIANRDHIPISFWATEKQDELFTTDVNKLQQIARKREREKEVTK